MESTFAKIQLELKDFQNEMKDLVSSGQEEEAINRLKERLNDNSLFNQLTIIEFQLSEIKSQRIKGSIDEGSFMTIKSKVLSNLLDFIDSIDSGDIMPFLSQFRTFKFSLEITTTFNHENKAEIENIIKALTELCEGYIVKMNKIEKGSTKFEFEIPIKFREKILKILEEKEFEKKINHPIKHTSVEKDLLDYFSEEVIEAYRESKKINSLNDISDSEIMDIINFISNSYPIGRKETASDKLLKYLNLDLVSGLINISKKDKEEDS